MIGDAYKIKYSDYVLNLDGTDNGRFIEIEVTDYTSRPGVNTTNLNHSAPAKRVPLDIVLYGHRSRGYGAPLWNNLFYLLENFAQPSETTSIFPRYDKNPTVGQIWVDTSSETAVPRWYGRDNTFYKLGASVNIAANQSQATPGELWFDTSSYTFKAYQLGWNDISCVPYVSQREYNTLAALTNALTTVPGTLPILTGGNKPTPTLWASLIAAVRVLSQVNGVMVPTSTLDALAANNFALCNSSVYGVGSIRVAFSQLRTAIDAISATLYQPTQIPVAGFAPSSTTGTIPMVVNFTNTSTRTAVDPRDQFGPTRYTWDFGDGTTSTAPGNVSHTYTSVGSRVVTLTLVNSAGTTSTQTTINAIGTPVAQFLIGPDTNPDVNDTAPFALAFTDQSSGSPTSWLWNFGDGAVSSERNPNHTYTTLGDFAVSLLVTNSAGSNTATVTHAVQVGRPTIANFTYTTPTRLTNSTSPFDVTFTDTSSNYPTSWLWDFGDGSTSTAQNPTHSYTSWGTYTVTLTATNTLSNTTLDVGNTSVKTMVDLVKVGMAPISSFTLSSSVGTLPLTITTTDTSANLPTTWSWDFGDGSSLVTTQQASHQYTSYDTRTVTLTISNINGSSTSSQTINVAPPAVVTNFIPSPFGGEVPLLVRFTDASSNSPTSWVWNFGDGNTSTAQNPAYTYTTPGAYYATLTASNYAGGNSLSREITVYRSSVVMTIAVNTRIDDFVVSENLTESQYGSYLTVTGTYRAGQTDISVYVLSGGVLGSSSGSPAFQIGNLLAPGDTVNLGIDAGAYVVGAGGQGGGHGVEGSNGHVGGDAIHLNRSITINNNGTIGGGGGGGGKGSTGDRKDWSGGGGGGASYGVGGRGANHPYESWVDSEGGYVGSWGGYGSAQYGYNGGSGTLTSGGGGGAGSDYGGIGGDGYGMSGGAGGSLGAAGSEGARWGAAQSPGAGGAPGAAIRKFGHTVTWMAWGAVLGAEVP